VPEVITIFEQLYRLGFPIEKIRTADHYPAADDELSMEDNNTSAFNCRGIPGTNQWSQHAYGRAIDLNPLLNPCIYASGACNRRPRRPTWTAAAPTRDSYTTATQPYTSSRTVAGGGVATGRLPSTTSTSSCPNPRPPAHTLTPVDGA
jgi:hypothetical protein